MPTITALGTEQLRVGSLRAIAFSRGGSRLWTLTGTVTTPRVGLRHGEMRSELSAWSVGDSPRGELRLEASVAVAPCITPALAAPDANEAVLVSSLGAMRFVLTPPGGLECVERLAPAETHGDAAKKHAWLRHAPFELIDSAAGTCFNVSANGAFGVERVEGGRLMVSRAADGARLAVSPPEVSMAGAACVDDGGRVVLFLAHGKVHRWDVGSAEITPLEVSGDGLVAINTEDDVFATYREHVGLHRLSTRAPLAATPYLPLGRWSVSHDVSRCAAFSPDGLQTMARVRDGWRLEQDIRPVRHVLLVGEVALLVRDEPRGGRIDVVSARGETLHTLRLSSPVTEALALSRSVPASSSTSTPLASLVSSLRGEPVVGPGAVFALATGDLVILTHPEDPRVTTWTTGRRYTHTLAFSEAHGLVVAGHGVKDGLRGRRYTGNSKLETADGVSVWSLDGTCLFNGLLTAACASSHALDEEGRLAALVGTMVHRYAARTGGATVGSPIAIPLTWDADGPAPRLLPNGHGVLTVVNGMIVTLDLRERAPFFSMATPGAQAVARALPQETPIVRSARTRILAVSGDSRRLLVAQDLAGENELALYALDQPETCLARWPSRATGAAALAHDGSAAVLSGGDAPAEWARF